MPILTYIDPLNKNISDVVFFGFRRFADFFSQIAELIHA